MMLPGHKGSVVRLNVSLPPKDRVQGGAGVGGRCRGPQDEGSTVCSLEKPRRIMNR